MVKNKISYILKVLAVGALLTGLLVWIFSSRVDVVTQSQLEGQSDSDQTIQLANIPDGTYEGSAEGHNGLVVVSVQVVDHHITAVRIIDHSETEGIADPALNQVPIAILSADSPEVDTVSGATVTSEAIKLAVQDALIAAEN